MEYFKKTIEHIKNLAEVSSVQLVSESVYYAQKQIRLQIYSCIYNGKNARIKIYNDPRNLPGYENSQAFANSFQPDINMPKVYTGASNSEDNIHKGWYIMEELEFTNDQITNTQYIEIYQKYYNHLKTINPESAKHIPKPKSTTEKLSHKINYWYSLPKQFNQFTDTESTEIKSELKSIKDTYLPLLLDFFKNYELQLTHSLFMKSKIHISKNNEVYLTDFEHFNYQYDGRDLAIFIWEEAIIKNLKSQNYDKIENEVLELISIVQQHNIFKQTNHILYSMMERCLGTLFADIWADNKNEPKEIKIDKHNAIINLLTKLKEQTTTTQ